MANGFWRESIHVNELQDYGISDFEREWSIVASSAMSLQFQRDLLSGIPDHVLTRMHIRSLP